MTNREIIDHVLAAIEESYPFTSHIISINTTKEENVNDTKVITIVFTNAQFGDGGDKYRAVFSTGYLPKNEK